MSLVSGFLVGLLLFSVFAPLSYLFGLWWWRQWHLAAPTLLFVPLFGVALLLLILNVGLHLLPGWPTVGLVIVLALLASFSLLKAGQDNAQQSREKTLLTVYLLLLTAYLLLVVPFLLINGWVITGYNVNNDSVFHNIMAEQFYEKGYKISNINDGKTAALKDKIVQQGYPDSFHHLLGLAYKLTGIRSYRLFNFTEAFFLALLTVTIFGLLFLTSASKMPTFTLFQSNLGKAFLALLSATSFLQLTYSFQGFAPQIAATPFIFAGLSLIFLLTVNYAERWRLLPSLSLIFAAGLGLFSFSVFIWWAAFTLLLLIRLAIKKELMGQAVLVLILAVFLASLLNPFAARNLPKTVAMANNFTSALGNLLSPKVPLLPVFGSWLAPDHRLVPQGKFLYLSWLGAALGFLGLAVAFWQLRHTLLNLAVTASFLALVLLKFKAGPYYFAKSLQPFSVLVLVMTLSGLLWLSTRKGWRWLFLPFLTVYLVLVLLANLAALKNASPAPKLVFAELERINSVYGKKSAWLLLVAAHQDWGRYILTNFKVVSPQALAHNGFFISRWTNYNANYNDEKRVDLDGFKIPFKRFSYLVIAKEQDNSSVPPVFAQSFSGRHFNVYAKKFSAGILKQHLPLETKDQAGFSGPYLKLYPGQELILNLKPAKVIAILGKLEALPNADSRGKTVVEQEKASMLVIYNQKQQRLTLTDTFKLYQLNSKNFFQSIHLKNVGSKTVVLDWLEVLKKPYPNWLLADYNRYVKKRRLTFGQF